MICDVHPRIADIWHFLSSISLGAVTFPRSISDMATFRNLSYKLSDFLRVRKPSVLYQSVNTLVKVTIHKKIFSVAAYAEEVQTS